MKTLVAFHNDPKIQSKYLRRVQQHRAADEMALAAIERKILSVDIATGEARSVRWPKPLGCRNPKGYVVFTLHLDGSRRQVKMHRLVWIAAHGIPPDGFVIDHINQKKDDNRIFNLRLADPILNSHNRRSYRGEHNPAAKINSDIVTKIRLLYRTMRSYSAVAQYHGVSRSLVAQIIRGELWNA